MKFVILSDIHGNLPALEAVTADIERWAPDHVIVNGDIVNRGPCSAACWDFIAERQKKKGWQLNKGNHEDYVLAYCQPDGDKQSRNLISYWTFRQLGDRMSAIARLPALASFSAPDHSELRVCHASMRGNRDGIGLNSDLALVRQQIAPAPAVFGTGHTHVPFIQPVDDTLVVNAGSVGTPCDGDERASYARVTWQQGRWAAEIVRVNYDRRQTGRDYQTTGFLDEAGPVARLFYHEWLTASPTLLPWIDLYGTRVAAGLIDEGAAVAAFLEQHTG